MFTTSFHPPPLRRAAIFVRHLISLDRHQLYIVIVADAYGWTQGLFWLSGRTVDSSLLTTCWSFFPSPFAYAYTYVMDLQQLPKREYSAQICHYRKGRNFTVFNKDDDSYYGA